MEHLYKQCERAFGFKVKALMSFESLGAEILKAHVGCVCPARQGWAAGVRRRAHRGFTPRTLSGGAASSRESSRVPTLHDQTFPGARERSPQWRPEAGLVSAVGPDSL